MANAQEMLLMPQVHRTISHLLKIDKEIVKRRWTKMENGNERSSKTKITKMQKERRKKKSANSKIGTKNERIYERYKEIRK